MSNVIIPAVVSLGSIGLGAAVILYFIAQKFKIIEDPRIDEVEEKLPGANCGGCGLTGCRAFAEAIVKGADLGDISAYSCPVGGNDTLAEISKLLGMVAEAKEPQVAVLRCSGTTANAQRKVRYDGPQTCVFAHALFAGESGCPNGCLGLGDCVVSCAFDAMYMDEVTGLPVIDDEHCVACNACVKACPRAIIELRNKGKKNKRIYVSCINTEKGALARKNCNVACIGCGKCVKICPQEAITMENNLAYIDYLKCNLCRKCVTECPTDSILELNFPPRKEKEAAKAEVVAES